MQEAQYAGLAEELLQPEQILFSRRKPLHRAQFIPQGAIISGTMASTFTFSTTPPQAPSQRKSISTG
jgi:hypothetical protein